VSDNTSRSTRHARNRNPHHKLLGRQQVFNYTVKRPVAHGLCQCLISRVTGHVDFHPKSTDTHDQLPDSDGNVFGQRYIVNRNDCRAGIFNTARSDFRIADWRNSDGGM
jgi:hypothetical protein